MSLFSPTRIIHSIILSRIVVHGPLHGYAIAAAIEEQFGWKPSQTTIYKALKKLESEKAVTAKERIEKGRAQKVYSITEAGLASFLEAKKKMMGHLGEKMSQLLSLMQNFSETDGDQDIEACNQSHGLVEEDMNLIPQYVFKLLRVAPEETQQILSDATTAFKHLAEKYNVDIEQNDRKGKNGKPPE